MRFKLSIILIGLQFFFYCHASECEYRALYKELGQKMFDEKVLLSARNQAIKCSFDTSILMLRSYRLAQFYERFGYQLQRAEALQFEVFRHYQQSMQDNLMRYALAGQSLANIYYKQAKFNSALYVILELEKHQSAIAAIAPDLILDIANLKLPLLKSLNVSGKGVGISYDPDKDFKAMSSEIRDIMKHYTPGFDDLSGVTIKNRKAIERLNNWLKFDPSQQHYVFKKRRLKKVEEHISEVAAEPAMDELLVEFGSLISLHYGNKKCHHPVTQGIIKRLKLDLVESDINRVNISALAAECAGVINARDKFESYIASLTTLFRGKPDDFEPMLFSNVQPFVDSLFNNQKWAELPGGEVYLFALLQILNSANPAHNLLRHGYGGTEFKLLLSQRQNLKFEIYKLLNQENTNIDTQSVQQHIEKLTRVEQSISTNYSEYSRFLFVQPFSIKRLKSLLSEKTALMLTHQSSEKLISLFIGRNKAFVHEANIQQSQLSDLIRDTREGVIAGKAPKQSIDQISEMFGVTRVAWSEFNKLYVVANGVLEQFPVTLLRNQESNDWLINMVAIERFLSTQTIQIIASERANRASGRLALAAPDYNHLLDDIGGEIRVKVKETSFDSSFYTSLDLGFDSSASESAKPDGSRSGGNYGEHVYQALYNLRPLNETTREAEKLMGSDLSQNKMLVGIDATQEKLSVSLQSNWNIVMYSTHTLFPQPQNGLDFPALALTPKSTVLNNDGLLTTVEIAALQHNHSWVILAACDTAKNISKNNYVGSLVNSFISSGARSVLASHWKIDSLKTVEFISLLSDSLLRMDDSMALWTTRKQLIAQGKTPDVWSSFDLYY